MCKYMSGWRPPKKYTSLEQHSNSKRSTFPTASPVEIPWNPPWGWKKFERRKLKFALFVSKAERIRFGFWVCKSAKRMKNFIEEHLSIAAAGNFLKGLHWMWPILGSWGRFRWWQLCSELFSGDSWEDSELARCRALDALERSKSSAIWSDFWGRDLQFPLGN